MSSFFSLSFLSFWDRYLLVFLNQNFRIFFASFAALRETPFAFAFAFGSGLPGQGMKQESLLY
jgi:hypothetical protein